MATSKTVTSGTVTWHSFVNKIILYDIPGSFKIETKSEKLKGLKSTSWLFISIESIILLILSNE